MDGTLYTLNLRSNLHHRKSNFSTLAVYPKEADCVQNENVPRWVIFKGRLGGDLGRLGALRGRSPFNKKM